MSLRKFSTDIKSLLVQDEELLRLLYYLPSNYSDNPLDPNKENILSKSDRWNIINDRIVFAKKFDDLETGAEPKCRLMVYPADGRSQNNNYMYANQEYHFEVYAHFDYQVDMRLEWICDRVNELIFNKRITGIGKVLFRSRLPLGAPNNYLGYRLVYEFGSGN